MDKKQQEIYDNLLLSAVFDLGTFPKKSGQEGTAYFVGDDFVIKEIMGDQESFYNYQNFEKYCKELCDYHAQGLDVPAIYSWTMLPKTMFEKSRFDRYYILQERIKGRDMFAHGIGYSFDDCKGFCSKKEFDAAMLSREGELYKKIVLTYLGNCLMMNEQLEALPESVIENFIMSDYQMMKTSEYGAIDMHSGNVLFDGKKLTVIDNGFMENFFARFQDEKLRQIVMKDMLRILSGNLHSLAFACMVKKKVPESMEYYQKQKVSSKRVVKRFVSATNRLLSPVFQNDFEYKNACDFIRNVVDGEDEKEIVAMLQKDF